MEITLFGIVSISLYLIAGLMLAMRLTGKLLPEHFSKYKILGIALIAVLLHTFILYGRLATQEGINIGFFNAISLLSWLIALLLLAAAATKPVESLGIVVLPLAALAILLDGLIPSEHLLSTTSRALGFHVLISVAAYSMLSIAALQAMLLSVQERHLHNKHPGGFIRALPPLQTMEALLFQMLAAGFVMQSLSLATGFMFLEDLFAQHLVHKTVLSILAWFVFAILLWGRWRYGWRGKTAIRWTLGGFVSLLLAYLGSKMVLELVLGR